MTLDLTVLTLAEALVERKAIKLRLDNLGARLVSNARVQEGDTPSEAPEALLAEVERAAGDTSRRAELFACPPRPRMRGAIRIAA